VQIGHYAPDPILDGRVAFRGISYSPTERPGLLGD
jgi:hypothetical protein